MNTINPLKKGRLGFISILTILFLLTSCEEVPHDNDIVNNETDQEPTNEKIIDTLTFNLDQAWLSDDITISWWENYYNNSEWNFVLDNYPELHLTFSDDRYWEWNASNWKITSLVLRAIILDNYSIIYDSYQWNANSICDFQIEIDMNQFRDDSFIEEIPVCSGTMQFYSTDSLYITSSVEPVVYDTFSVKFDSVWMAGAGVDYDKAKIISYNDYWDDKTWENVPVRLAGRFIADFLTNVKDVKVEYMNIDGETEVEYTYLSSRPSCSVYMNQFLLQIENELISNIVITGSFKSDCRIMSSDEYYEGDS